MKPPRNRFDDARRAMSEGEGVSWLARLWNISNPAASEWCAANLAKDDHRQLAENGRNKLYQTKPSTADRLAMIDLCRRADWSQARIARAIGICPSALSLWIKNNAPDGIKSALEDFTDDEPLLDRPTPAPAAA